VHVLVLLAAGFALCFGESINLNGLDYEKTLRTRLELQKEKNLNKLVFKRGFALAL
jgi:hypothetical protein